MLIFSFTQPKKLGPYSLTLHNLHTQRSLKIHTQTYMITLVYVSCIPGCVFTTEQNLVYKHCSNSPYTH